MFFFNRTQIPRSLVEKLVTLDGGEILWWLGGRAQYQSIELPDPNRDTIGIYTSLKWHRRLFPFEVQIVHDLTTVVTPQFHGVDTVEFWQGRLFSDMASSDLIVAISQSTERDIRTYFPALREIPCIVAHLAPSTTLTPPPVEKEAIEPYVAILGTLEPRKNVEFVFDYISRHKDVAESVVFVFIGRFGWGATIDQFLDRYNVRSLMERRRIRFAGFVSDSVRDHLLAYARAVIYASRYEGFGLPVIEALSYGVPVITTFSSSLPEAGGSVATYCDVSDPKAFARSLNEVLDISRHETDNACQEMAAERRAWSAGFSWNRTYLEIKNAALRIQSGRHA